MSGDLQDQDGNGIGTKTFLIFNNITSTRHHKQILVLSLEILKQRAFSKKEIKEDENCDLLFG